MSSRTKSNQSAKKPSPNKGKIMVDPNDLQKLISNATNKDWQDVFLKAQEARYLQRGGAHVNEPFSQSSLVYACVRIVGTNFPQAPFEIYKDDRRVSDDDPVAMFWQYPSTVMSRFEFWESIAATFALYGEAFLYIVPSLRNEMGNGGLPGEMQPLHPRGMKEVVDPDTGKLKGWLFKAKNKDLSFTVDEIIHFKSYNPNNVYRGASPIDSIQIALNTDRGSESYSEKFFVNGAAPLGLIEMGEDQEDSIEEMKKLLKLWNSAHQGVQRSHKIGVIRHGMKYSPMGISQKEMDFIDGRKFTREQILSAMNVPPPVVGIYTESQYSSTKVAKGLFWRENLVPFGLRVEENLMKNFFRTYATGYKGHFRYDHLPEMQRDYATRVEEAKGLFNMGVAFDEINTRLDLGFEPQPNLDVGYIPVSYVPLSEAGELYDPSNSDIDPEGGVDEEKSLKTGQIDKNSFKTTRRNRRIQKMIHAVMDKHERPFRSKMKRYFFEQRQKVLRLLGQYTKETSVEILAEISGIFEEEDDRLVKLTTPLYIEAVKEGQEVVTEILGLDREVILDQDIVNRKTQQIKGVNKTIHDRVRKAVFEGIGAGASTDVLTEEIEEAIQGVKGVYNTASNRAKIIARTEVAQAVSMATQQEYKNSGIAKNAWLTAGDNRVRDEHVANQAAGPIPIGASFPSGETYPGENSVNCRCTLIPIIE